MKTPLKLPILALCLCTLVGCGSFIETKHQTDQAATLLEKDLGVRPEVGFNIFNGKLVAVTVVFDSEKLKEMSVSELESRVHRILASTLSQKPQQIIVSLRANGLKSDNERANQTPGRGR